MITVLIFVFLCAAGAYFIADTICKRVLKTKSPKNKSTWFLSIFLLSFLLIAGVFMVIIAMSVPFGRYKPVYQPVPADQNLRNQ